MRFTIDRLDHLVIACKDVELSASWYQRVLGMERAAEADEGVAVLKFGGQLLVLHGSNAKCAMQTQPAGTGADLCFVTAVGADHITEHLLSSGVTIKHGPITSRGALGDLTSVYCNDPDGNLIKIGSYFAL